jgi:hypothetical protein
MKKGVDIDVPWPIIDESFGMYLAKGGLGATES